jgi:hypothetical protein
MKNTLSYGRLKWSYEDFDPERPCRPSPLFTFSPIRINGKMKSPHFTDKITLALLKHKSIEKKYFRDLYVEWHCEGSWIDRELGEGRSFYRWLQKTNQSIEFRPHDFKLHSYFTQANAPRHDADDDMAKGLSFAIRPVKVGDRNVKLYLQDECMMNLLTMPFGEDEDFLELVKEYVNLRFQWEKWRAPAPPFLDWLKARAKRPVFSTGQLGFCL